MPQGASFEVAALCGDCNANEPLPVSSGTILEEAKAGGASLQVHCCEGVCACEVSRGHDGVGGPGCCSEQLKQTWAKKSRMASVGSASSTSPATSSFATTTTGYATRANCPPAVSCPIPSIVCSRTAAEL
ncbi:hypothetical protein E3U43_019016 [Larimichthys crocea]|uniref:Uncharacterized protein n=1 Tax=Larimichthys crocea TaxID=215358 RepID=A0ACD3QWV3_LARCR|nr:hypothetical protein E3U43_019016 [Larimichthys crocea]